MAKITVNGTTIHVADGSSISINNGNISVGGSVIFNKLSGQIDVKWEGPVGDIRCDGDFSGGDVSGNVHAGGSVTCNNIGGKINAGGSVRAAGYSGPINAGGSVRIGN